MAYFRKVGATWSPKLDVQRIEAAAPIPPDAPATSPWGPLLASRNVLPTPDGVGATIHPTVLDMGSAWNGYRWWQANTPYAGGNDDLENPCVWGSNDRINWTVPAGLTNPLEPNPATVEKPNGFHSDTELAYEPTTGTMWLWWRYADDVPATFMDLRAASSTNGVDWTLHGVVHTFSATPWASPAIVRVAANDWRMFVMSGTASTRRLTATSPLGPWTDVGFCTQTGGTNGQFRMYHGDIIRHDGNWWAMYGATSSGSAGYAAISTDGIAWAARSAPILTGGFLDDIYRPTIQPSAEPGFMDVWTSGNDTGSPGGRATGYTRVPLSFWTDLL